MFKIEAPAELIVEDIILPNPQFSDSESSTNEVTPLRAVDGTLYTYCKHKTHLRCLWEFRLYRTKGIELEQFVRKYLSNQWKVTDHNAQVWLGYLSNNPVELRSEGRAAPIAGWPAAERQSVTIEFEGVKQV